MTPGTRLGPYEVLSRLGAGGMGEDYTARDTRLWLRPLDSLSVRELPGTLGGVCQPGMRDSADG